MMFNTLRRLGVFVKSVMPQLTGRAMSLVLIWLGLVCVLTLFLVMADFLRWQVPIVMLKAMIYLSSLGLFGLLGFDYLRLLYLKFGFKVAQRFFVARKLAMNLPVYQSSPVTLMVHCEGLPAWTNVDLMDYYPLECQAEFLPIRLTADELDDTPKQDGTSELGSEIGYELKPMERGFLVFGGMDLRLSSSLGLVSMMVHIPSAQIEGSSHARALADFKGMFGGNLYAIAKQAAVGGLIRQRRRGQGQDFHQIRGYIDGDSIRHIDWRATARQGKLMTREFQDEKDQEIMFLLDASQYMRHVKYHDDVISQSHLDMALGSMLLLANIAKEQGDATGFISFSGINDKIVLPKKGTNIISHLLNQSFDVKPSLLMPDYIAAAKSLLSIQRKRSLIILITNHQSQDTSELMDAIHLLRAKHVVVLASLYEEDMADFLGDMPTNADEAMTYHSIQDHINGQKSLVTKFANMSHVYPISCTPNQLPALLVENYLTLKRRHGI